MGGLADIGAQGGLRFQFVNAIPATTAVVYTAGVVSSGAFGTGASMDSLRRAVEGVSVRELGVGAFVVTLLSLLSNSFHERGVKILEGYWRPAGIRLFIADRSLTRQWERRTYHGGMRAESAPLRRWDRLWLRLAGERFHDRLLDELRVHAGAVADSYPQVVLGSPPEDSYQPPLSEIFGENSPVPDDDRIMPTRLGNALRHAEDRAGDRFGLPAVDLMPYLLAVADDDARAQFDDTRTELDVSVRFVFVWLYCSALSVAAFVDDGPWMFAAVATFVLAWISYEAAVIAARNFGELLAMIVTMWRFDLLRRLSWPLPQRVGDEAAAFAEVVDLIEFGTPAIGRLRRYEHPSKN